MKMKKFLMKSLAYRGILAVEATNNIQEECPERGIHLQRLARDATIILQVNTPTGAAPSFPSVCNMEIVKVSSIGVLLKPELDRI